MMSKLRLFVAVLGSILAATLAGAQSHGVGVTGQMPSVAIRPAVRISGPSSAGYAARPLAVRPGSRLRVVPGNRVISGFTPPTHPAGNEDGIGVPGLGFDYPHLAAISGGLGGDGHRGFERGMHSGQGFMVPILFGGYPYYFDGSLDYGQADQVEQPQSYPVQQQPQIIVIQQPVPAPVAQQARVSQEADAATSAGQSPESSSPAAQAPVRNLGEIILIRKDGRVVFASAFSVVGTQLRYISPEGILQRFPVTELDSEATQQMNEARGNSVEINN